MIDWLAVIFNAIWVSGSAVLLATLGYAGWQASSSGMRWRDCLAQAGYQQALLGGGFLLSLGLAGVVDQVWRQLMFVAMALICGGLLGLLLYRSRIKQ